MAKIRQTGDLSLFDHSLVHIFFFSELFRYLFDMISYVEFENIISTLYDTPNCGRSFRNSIQEFVYTTVGFQCLPHDQKTSVADPDPVGSDHFGSPGSGSLTANRPL